MEIPFREVLFSKSTAWSFDHVINSLIRFLFIYILFFFFGKETAGYSGNIEFSIRTEFELFLCSLLVVVNFSKFSQPL